MATALIKVISSDNVLEFSGSMAILRQIEIPPGASDIRLGMGIMVSSSFNNSTEQVYNPAVSRFETYRFGLTSGPSITPGGPSGTYVTAGQNVGGEVKLYGADNGKKTMFLVNMQAVFSPNTSSKVDNTVNAAVPVRAGESSTSIHVFRLVKNSTNQIIASLRDTTLSFVSLPMSDATFNTYLTNLGNTGEYVKSTYTFASEGDRDTAFAALNTLCITWPYYTIPLRTAAIGYRIL